MQASLLLVVDYRQGWKDNQNLSFLLSLPSYEIYEMSNYQAVKVFFSHQVKARLSTTFQNDSKL